MFLPTFITSEHPGSHVFQQTRTVFIHIQDIIKTNILTKKIALPPDIIKTNLLTKFHEDQKINVASGVLTRKNAPPYIIGINLLTKFHEDLTINVASRVKNALPLGSHVFQAKVTIFELIQDIIETNLLTKFHEDWTINVASRVFTRNTAPPPGDHLHEDWASNVTSTVFTSFKLNQTINVASRVFTRQNVDDARRTKDDHKSSL
ncbi:hypothetical protein DPMN_095864 [Dreissena polymorpha]|uniref:Uncharacterized protein n=1 Tax=Dreissena polymorpha TaxID=45954 RepID=A0A9D4L7A5_DREPO|nr:hypothetical protein DPMN_095864 [Dreissena polymorpha]